MSSATPVLRAQASMTTPRVTPVRSASVVPSDVPVKLVQNEKLNLLN
jgi:hypothetical protein